VLEAQAMSKKIVIIGGGLSSKHAAEILVKKAKDATITIIQANRFVEWPLAIPHCLVNPSAHDKALATNCEKFQVSGVNYKYAVVESVDTAAKEITIVGTQEKVPYDALIVATGFNMPLVYPGLGVTIEERKKEVQKVAEAIKSSECIVVAGGGPVGIEIAGCIRGEHPSKRVILLGSKDSAKKVWRAESVA
jgi:NADH dehydrogenase FAD-containing subunit